MRHLHINLARLTPRARRTMDAIMPKTTPTPSTVDALAPKWQPDSPDQDKLNGMHSALSGQGYKWKYTGGGANRGEMHHVYENKNKDNRLFLLERKNGKHSIEKRSYFSGDSASVTTDEHIGFAKLKQKLSHEKGVHDPGAVAAAIGRKKYGAKKFAAMSHDARPWMPETGNHQLADKLHQQLTSEGFRPTFSSGGGSNPSRPITYKYEKGKERAYLLAYQHGNHKIERDRTKAYGANSHSKDAVSTDPVLHMGKDAVVKNDDKLHGKLIQTAYIAARNAKTDGEAIRHLERAIKHAEDAKRVSPEIRSNSDKYWDDEIAHTKSLIAGIKSGKIKASGDASPISVGSKVSQHHEEYVAVGGKKVPAGEQTGVVHKVEGERVYWKRDKFGDMIWSPRSALTTKDDQPTFAGRGNPTDTRSPREAFAGRDNPPRTKDADDIQGPWSVEEYRYWAGPDGRKASIFGAPPWTNPADKKLWTMVTAGFTLFNKRSNTRGVNGSPFASFAEAQARADSLNAAQANYFTRDADAVLERFEKRAFVPTTDAVGQKLQRKFHQLRAEDNSSLRKLAQTTDAEPRGALIHKLMSKEFTRITVDAWLCGVLPTTK